MLQCHNCKFNGLSSENCLCCQLSVESYNYPFQNYLINDDIAVDDRDFFPNEQEYVTSLDPEVEDKLRIVLNVIFSLSQTELLVLQGIFQKKSLQEISTSLENLFRKNQKEFTRFRTFQLRKSILRKHNELSGCLVTQGQRKRLNCGK